MLDAGQPLADADEECAAIVLDALAREGVAIRTGIEFARIERANGRVQVIFKSGEGEQTIDGTHLLVATERKAPLDGLDLAAGGIAANDTGIVVNAMLKTSNKRVYAIGATIGQPRAANHHAGLVIRNAVFRARFAVGPHTAARLVLTEPELARAGLTESDARAQKLKFCVARWPYYDNARAQAERETHGHVKVIVTPKGKILGTTIVGAQAGEVIGAWALAAASELNISAFTDLPLPSPTRAEIGKNAALDFFVPRLTSGWTRRIIRWLRLLG